MPRLYLELIENKEKIKPELIDKEYEIKDNNKQEKEKDNNKQEQEKEQDNNKQENQEVNDKDSDKDNDSNMDNDKEKDSDNEKESSDEKYKQKGKESSNEKYKQKGKESNNEKEEYSDEYYYKNKKIQNNSNKLVDEVSKESDKYEDYSEDNEKVNKKNNEDNEGDDEDITQRLKKLLSNNTEDSNERSITPQKNKYSSKIKKKDNFNRSINLEKSHINYENNKDLSRKIPPSLEELRRNGDNTGNKDNLRDISYNGLNDIEFEDKKRELMFKFELLKKAYPNSSIPEFSIHSDYTTMQKAYDDNVRRLSLDSTVENYKQYLIYGFMLTEFVLGNFLKFDMQGFTQQQIVSMSSYEKLLIELGEKSYIPEGSRWPVEVRLIFMIVINAAFFIVSRLILKKTGANLMSMMNSSNKKTTETRRKNTMKGPTIDINDIPEMNSV
jgi:chemotaxis protein histidine kinase CheA